MVLAIIACYIFRFAQVTTLETWWHGGLFVAICFVVLCLLSDLGLPSKQQAERMQILAGLSLTLIFLVCLGLLFYMFIFTNLISAPIFGAMLIASFVAYAL